MSKDSENKIPLLPLNGRLIVLPEEKQKMTTSGLYLADTTSGSEKPSIGTVIRLGLEKTDEDGNKIPFNVKQGMKVMFSKYAGDPVEFDGKKYLLISESDVMAIYED